MSRVQARPAIAALAASLLLTPARPMATANDSLTAVPGIKVGHVTLPERPTGCTVMLAEPGAVAGVDVRGAAPGTRETDLLDPINTVDRGARDRARRRQRVRPRRRVWRRALARRARDRLRRRPSRACRSCRRRSCSTSASATRRIRPTADCGYRAAAQPRATGAGRRGQRRRGRGRDGREARAACSAR